MRALVLFAAVLTALSGPPAFAARDGSGLWQLAVRDDRGGKAERHQDHPTEQDRGSRRGGRDRDQAVRRAQREYGGRVLSVDRMPDDEQQRERYRIKLLSEGHVRTVDVEADEED